MTRKVVKEDTLCFLQIRPEAYFPSMEVDLIDPSKEG
jgi:hypothetical protein